MKHLILFSLLLVLSCSTDVVIAEQTLQDEAYEIDAKLQKIVEPAISEKGRKELVEQLELEFLSNQSLRSEPVCSATTSKGNKLEIYYEGWGMYSYTITAPTGESVSGGNYFYLTMVISGWCEGLAS